VLASIIGCQRVAIGAGRAAGDAVLVVAGILSGGVPWPVIDHRTFDSEHTTVMVGDDQVEWLGCNRLGPTPVPPRRRVS